MAHHDRDRHRLAPRFVLGEVAEGVAGQDQRAGTIPPLDLEPVEGHVAGAGLRVTSDREPGGDEGAGVQRAGDVRWKLEEVDVIPRLYDLLDRRVGNFDGRDGVVDEAGDCRDHLMEGGAEGKCSMAQVGRCHPEHSPALVAGDPLEQEAMLARLVEERAHLGPGVDRFANVDQLLRGLEIIDPGPHILRHCAPPSHFLF